MFGRELYARHLVQPFPVLAEAGSYWLTALKPKPPSPAMTAFRDWCLAPEFREPVYSAN
jgi:LysR family transcriptional regulator of beta-lactamase